MKLLNDFDNLDYSKRVNTKITDTAWIFLVLIWANYVRESSINSTSKGDNVLNNQKTYQLMWHKWFCDLSKLLHPS